MGFLKREINVELLFEAIAERFSEKDQELIRRAYELAENKHKDQKRHSGAPYIIHPVNVAYILNELRQ